MFLIWMNHCLVKEGGPSLVGGLTEALCSVRIDCMFALMVCVFVGLLFASQQLMMFENLFIPFGSGVRLCR